jgi:hypothetical protein
MAPSTYKVTVIGTPTPSGYPEREMTPVFARVMEIGLLMCGVCFYPTVLLSEQSADHFDEAKHCQVSFHKLKALFYALPF